MPSVYERLAADGLGGARALALSAVAVLAPVTGPAANAEDDPWAKDRAAMVRTIEAYGPALPASLRAEGMAPEVLRVMGETPRHRFVPEEIRALAYADRPLPIGYGQTISQPLIVALMTHLLKPHGEARMLEIGSGSGYQAAVLAPLVKKLCSIEIIPPLGERASATLTSLGYDNVATVIGDGYFGWPDCGPFDGIVVTAAAGHVPPPLVAQLKPGGRMVIPVGGAFGPQYLTLVEKSATGDVKTRQLLAVRFVPLTRSQE